MKQSFCFKNFFVIHVSLIAGMMTICSVNPALAEPNCFMIDSNGNMMNLSSLCGSSKSNSGSPTSRITPPLPSEQNSPNNNLDQSTEQKSDPNNPNNPTTKGDSNSNEGTQADNNTSEKKEVDRSELPPVQRAIPLINKQRNPEATEEP